MNKSEQQNKPRSNKRKSKRSGKSKHTQLPDGKIVKQPRDIPTAEWKLLWGRSAGRCQFNGCNRITYRAPVSNQLVITSQHAHVIAFSKDGPRGEVPIDSEALNRYPNLMLLCYEHHRNIDDRLLQHGYTVETLQRWKEEHEERVERATSFTPEVETHTLVYSGSIRGDLTEITEQQTRAAMHPMRFPSNQGIIRLGYGSRHEWRDHEGDGFWVGECHNLQKAVGGLKRRLADHPVQSFSVFAIAPQPLLIYFGSLLPELKNVEVFQRHKYPSVTWKWPEESDALQSVEITRPESREGTPVLLLEFSARVEESRIKKVVSDADIWRLGVAEPAYDAIRSRDQLVDFHRQSRRVLDEIKYVYGEETPLHVFPVGPVSINVEFGKVRAPKTDVTWILYDQISNERGFEAVLNLTASEVTGCLCTHTI